MEERPKKSVSVGTGSVLDEPMNRKDFRSANKAVVVMVPRGGSPNHTADVGIGTNCRGHRQAGNLAAYIT